MPTYKQFPLADTAEGLTEADILEWKVSPGDTVTVNQIVVEIETAKAAVELPIPWAGVVTELLVEPGQTVEVGAPILTVDVDPGGAPSAKAEPEPAPAEEEEEMKPLVGYGSKTVVAKRRARKESVPAGAGVAAKAGAISGEIVSSGTVQPARASAISPEIAGSGAAASATVPLAKPPVRKLAKDLGIDLRTLTGSGSNGVITRDDVHSAANGSSAPNGADVAAAYDPASRERRVPVKGVRKATASAMVASAFSAPHVTEFLTVDVTPMMEFRARLKNQPQFRELKLTPLTFAAKAVCLASKRTPDVNALWDEEAQEIVYKDYVHLGIAAATPRGLIVPKIRDADAKSLAELAGSISELTATAREGKTPPADMVNGTITITNVGVFGVDTGTPIINPGESAILALGSIRDTPWVVDGQIAVRKVCQLSLSFDHRVVDGQQGSQFLADVGAIFSDPANAITF